MLEFNSPDDLNNFSQRTSGTATGPTGSPEASNGIQYDATAGRGGSGGLTHIATGTTDVALVYQGQSFDTTVGTNSISGFFKTPAVVNASGTGATFQIGFSANNNTAVYGEAGNTFISTRITQATSAQNAYRLQTQIKTTAGSTAAVDLGPGTFTLDPNTWYRLAADFTHSATPDVFDYTTVLENSGADGTALVSALQGPYTGTVTNADIYNDPTTFAAFRSQETRPPRRRVGLVHGRPRAVVGPGARGGAWASGGIAPPPPVGVSSGFSVGCASPDRPYVLDRYIGHGFCCTTVTSSPARRSSRGLTTSRAVRRQPTCHFDLPAEVAAQPHRDPRQAVVGAHRHHLHAGRVDHERAGGDHERAVGAAERQLHLRVHPGHEPALGVGQVQFGAERPRATGPACRSCGRPSPAKLLAGELADLDRGRRARADRRRPALRHVDEDLHRRLLLELEQAGDARAAAGGDQRARRRRCAA